MLTQKYGLTGNDPYRFLVYERSFPLSGELATALSKENGDQLSAASHQREESSCKVQADG
jgi:hypothetical protein